jgi:DNA transposition AAA+ family ATPase
MYLDANVKAAIRKALIAKVAEAGITDIEFQKRNGITQATYFNQIKNGTYSDKYPGHDLWEKIATIIGYSTTKTYWKHFDIAHHDNIKKIANRAKRTSEAWILSGDTGYGKSYTLIKLYQEAGANDNIYYYRAYDEKVSPADFLRRLLLLMGIKKMETGREVLEDGKLKKEKKPIEKIGLAALSKELITRLCDKSEPLLIIDESEFLSIACLKELRKVVYETRGKAGILICGADIDKRLLALSNRKKAQEQGWKQLYSRLQWNISTLLPIGYNETNQAQADFWSNEVNKICTELGIKEKAVMKYIVQNSFNMRDLEHFVTKLLEGADKLNMQPSLAVLKKVLDNSRHYIKEAQSS